MFLIGLTGSIATGKSTVSRILQGDCGCAVVDADLIAREVLLPGKPAFNDVVKTFGSTVLNEDGTVDRAALGNIIFQDPQLRKALNSITHPRIAKAMLWQILKHFLGGKRFIILDIPLLIETKLWLKFVRHVLVVYCEPNIQLQRLRNRNNFNDIEAHNHINSQMAIKEKLKYATCVIDNSGSLSSTKKQVLDFHTLLKNQWSFTIYEWLFALVGISLLAVRVLKF